MTKGLFDLTGKVTVVTGGNGGLGLGYARGIAKQGGDLAIWARDEEKNTAAKAELEALGAGRVLTRRVDVASEEEIIAAYDALLEDAGRVDVVFANAGVSRRSPSNIEMTTEEYHGLLAINLHGAYYTLREGARHMVARAEAGEPGGSLVMCGSLSMFVGLPGMAHYAMAKGAMGAMVRSLAVELGKYDIRANTIAPGLVRVDRHGGTDSSPTSSRTPIPRPGHPEDFEGIAAYLASDASAFHTGDTIVIDGGYLVSL
jgi:NAD(P)-dependent dehydrogenase (short-subunit alcohol dehydrogenase family)